LERGQEKKAKEGINAHRKEWCKEMYEKNQILMGKEEKIHLERKSKTFESGKKKGGKPRKRDNQKGGKRKEILEKKTHLKDRFRIGGA